MTKIKQNDVIIGRAENLFTNHYSSKTEQYTPPNKSLKHGMVQSIIMNIHLNKRITSQILNLLTAVLHKNWFWINWFK